MHRTSRGSLVACATAACSLLLIAAPLTVPAQAAADPVVDPAIARSPELSETTRLSDRRFVVTGHRAWALGTADGRYPAAGFHTRGEMGGFWLPNLKLLDGMWLGINDDWIGPATKTTSGWGYVRADLPTTDGVSASRTDFVPRGVSRRCCGTESPGRAHPDHHATRRRALGAVVVVSVGRDPTQPTQANLADSVSIRGKHLLFRDKGTPPESNSESHDWAAAFGSALAPLRIQDGERLPRPTRPGSDLPGVRSKRTTTARTL